MLSPLGVKASQLVVGRAYFIVTYVDDALVVPIVDSVIFLGESLDGESERTLYFQDVKSFYQLGGYPDFRESGSDVMDRAVITVVAVEPPPNIFALDGLIDELSRAVLRPTLE